MASKNKVDRDMLGEIKHEKKGDDDDDDDDEDKPPPDAGKQWYQIPQKTRVYDCKTAGLPLLGSNLGGNTGVPTIYCEAYFYWDITQVKELTGEEDEGAKEDNFWRQCQRMFDSRNHAFQKDEYMIP